jgi:hypothetical protein
MASCDPCGRCGRKNHAEAAQLSSTLDPRWTTARGRLKMMALQRFPMLAVVIVVATRPEQSTAVFVARGPLNGTDLADAVPNATYSHTYRHFANKTAGALQCQRDCDEDAPRCASWTYVAGWGVGTESRERCCLHSSLGCPQASVGLLSGARVPGNVSRLLCTAARRLPHTPGAPATCAFVTVNLGCSTGW